MPSTFADLEYQALLLSPEDRVQLADRLLASLSSNPSVEQEWSAESLRDALHNTLTKATAR